MNISRAVRFGAAILALLCLAEPAKGCSCAQVMSPAAGMRSATAVFAGWVARFTTDPISGRRRAIFWVTRSWKGDVSHVIAVETDRSQASCGYDFRVGRKYVVYARGIGALMTNICTRTCTIETAGADLAYLGTGTVPYMNYLLGVAAIAVIVGGAVIVGRRRRAVMPSDF